MHGGLKFLLWTVALILIVVIAWFAINLTGLRAWRDHVVAMRSAGVELEEGPYEPALVEDGKNMFKSPILESVALRDMGLTPEAVALLVEPAPFAPANVLPIAALRSWDSKAKGMPSTEEIDKIANRPETPARFVLSHYEAMADEVAEVHAACDRPRSRPALDYRSGFESVPDFVEVRRLAQTFNLRARANLALGNTEAALDDLNVLRRLALMSEGRPATLVQAMIEVAVLGLMVDTIEDAFREGALSVKACEELQRQLEFFDLPASLVFSLKRGEIPGLTRVVLDARGEKGRNDFPKAWKLVPDGVVRRNLIVCGNAVLETVSGVDLEGGTVDPAELERVATAQEERFKSFSISTYLARFAVPNVSRTMETAARNQMRIRLARIACALEGFRLEHDVFPESLGDLAPRFIDPLPQDIVTGKLPVYRLTGPAGYELYSVGWNAVDDGGAKNGDLDWIWRGGLGAGDSN